MTNINQESRCPYGISSASYRTLRLIVRTFVIFMITLMAAFVFDVISPDNVVERITGFPLTAAVGGSGILVFLVILLRAVP